VEAKSETKRIKLELQTGEALLRAQFRAQRILEDAVAKARRAVEDADFKARVHQSIAQQTLAEAERRMSEGTFDLRSVEITPRALRDYARQVQQRERELDAESAQPNPGLQDFHQPQPMASSNPDVAGSAEAKQDNPPLQRVGSAPDSMRSPSEVEEEVIEVVEDVEEVDTDTLPDTITDILARFNHTQVTANDRGSCTCCLETFAIGDHYVCCSNGCSARFHIPCAVRWLQQFEGDYRMLTASDGTRRQVDGFDACYCPACHTTPFAPP